MSADIIRYGLEVLHDFLSLIDDGFVLQDGAIVGEINGRWLGVERAGDALGVAMPLPQSLQRGDRFY